VRKNRERIAARALTERTKTAGRSLFERKRNLARIIKAEIHSVKVTKGVERGSAIRFIDEMFRRVKPEGM